MHAEFHAGEGCSSRTRRQWEGREEVSRKGRCSRLVLSSRRELGIRSRDLQRLLLARGGRLLCMPATRDATHVPSHRGLFVMQMQLAF